jgi:hypothetical protein
MTDHVSTDAPRRGFTALVEIERDEQDEENPGWVIFDGFRPKQNRRRARHIADFHLLALRVPFASIAQFFPNIAEMQGHWVNIEVAAQATANSCSAEVVMFGTNARRLLHIISAAPTTLNKHENSIFMLENEPRSAEEFIEHVLDSSLRHSQSLAVAAYDVGQGNCNAIVDQHEHPRVFFDLGWAPNFHARTRPPRQPAFFSCDDHVFAPVVLSHWDMDHWCYAIARTRFNPANLTTRHTWNQEALNRFWIARAPLPGTKPLGPLAQSFYSALASTPAMLLWPDDCDRIPFSDGWLEACVPASPDTHDRNNTGIAMFVQPGGEGPAILLTGDADFPSISSLSSSNCPELAGMVAPHHGSYITTTAVPKPMAGSPATLALSVGQNNHYGHPKLDALNAYKLAGWAAAATQNRHTCDRWYPLVHDSYHDHGNILLKFAVLNLDPECRCERVPQGNLCLVPSHAPVVTPVPGI